MGENAWRELMQSLSQFVKVTDQLNGQNILLQLVSGFSIFKAFREFLCAIVMYENNNSRISIFLYHEFNKSCKRVTLILISKNCCKSLYIITHLYHNLYLIYLNLVFQLVLKGQVLNDIYGAK